MRKMTFKLARVLIGREKNGRVPLGHLADWATTNRMCAYMYMRLKQTRDYVQRSLLKDRHIEIKSNWNLQ